MGLIHYPEMSVTTYQPTVCNIPEEHRPHLYHSVSLRTHSFEVI